MNDRLVLNEDLKFGGMFTIYLSKFFLQMFEFLICIKINN